jgi:hypothetical protein
VNIWRIATIYLTLMLINITVNVVFHQNDPGEVLRFIASCWAFSILATAVTYAVVVIRNRQK